MGMSYRCKNESGRDISLLGYGAMRMPTVDGGHANGWVSDGYSAEKIDQEELNRQIRYLLDHGVTYYDTSPAYCRGESEACLGKALKASGYARTDYLLATKLSNFEEKDYPLDACKRMFEKSLVDLQTDYIDNYLLHAIGNGGFATFSKRYLENGALDWCATLRAEKRIRNLGFSFHGDPKAFEWCMAHHDTYKWDFCQIQMNYIDWLHAKEVNERNLNAKYLYETLAEKNIPIVVMEPLLGGALARYNYALASTLKPLDDKASLAQWAFRFFGNHPKVMTVLSGMTRFAHVKENVETFSPLRPCSPEEEAALERAAQAYLNLKTVPCTGCRYCMPCPQGVDIPGVFSFRNAVLSSKNLLSSEEVKALYDEYVPDEEARADRCVGCGICRRHCPQHIDIPKELTSIAGWYAGLTGTVQPAEVEVAETKPEVEKKPPVGHIPCVQCHICGKHCPHGIDIEGLFRFKNEVLTKGDTLSPEEILALYEKAVPEESARAGRCIGCGKCDRCCPLEIDISREIAAIDRFVNRQGRAIFLQRIEKANKEASKWF